APHYREEEPPAGADPIEVVRAHAVGKARSVAGEFVLAVDTEVVLDGEVYGKPGDADDARAMLRRLAGRTHDVVSGLCLRSPAWEEIGHAVTHVTFRAGDDREIAAYVELGEWRNRAGGYAVQGRGARFIEQIEGDYLNVVGLPAALLCDV